MYVGEYFHKIVPKAIFLKSAEDNRSSITPDLVKKFIQQRIDVYVEKDISKKINIDDAEYKALGAKIFNLSSKSLVEFDIVIGVLFPQDFHNWKLKNGAIVIGICEIYSNRLNINAILKNNVKLIALENVPRITRAQNIDVLSSQNNLMGYLAVIESANHYNGAMPMFMTAAGTVKAASVLVIGAGVAGLQAIATAKRLGGVVFATDVRAAAKEQVESLGGKFLIVEGTDSFEDKSGYAREATDSFKKKQKMVLKESAQKSDIIITTAQVPKMKAPIIIDEEIMSVLKPGCVIVDLAAHQGGNCIATKNGEVVTQNGVKVVGNMSINKVAGDASLLYAKNVYNLISYINGDDGIKIDETDDMIGPMIVKGNQNSDSKKTAQKEKEKKSKPNTKSKTKKKEKK